MDFGKGGLLILAGLFVLWIAVTGRTQKLFEAIGVIRGAPKQPEDGAVPGGKIPVDPFQVFTPPSVTQSGIDTSHSGTLNPTRASTFPYGIGQPTDSYPNVQVGPTGWQNFLSGLNPQAIGIQ